MESISCEVGHVVEELILFHDYRRAASIAVVRVFDMDCSTCSADVFSEDIVTKDDRALITPDIESRHLLKSIYNSGIIEFLVCINNFRKQLCSHIITFTCFELEIVIFV